MPSASRLKRIKTGRQPGGITKNISNAPQSKKSPRRTAGEERAIIKRRINKEIEE